MICFSYTPQRTDVALGCCSCSLVPMDGDGRVAVGRGVSLHHVRGCLTRFCCSYPWFCGEKGIVPCGFLPCPSLRSWDGELMFRDGTGASVLPCWVGGRDEQALLSPWDFLL